MEIDVLAINFYFDKILINNSNLPFAVISFYSLKAYKMQLWGFAEHFIPF